MSAESTSIRNNQIIFPDQENIEKDVEYRLQRRYGRGLFIQETFEAPDDQLIITLGTSYPKDVSDRRERDKVLKYINVGDVKKLHAEPTGEGFYAIELPDRSELREAFQTRKQEMVSQLDWSMAKTIFDDVYQLDPVKNQLTSLNQIVRWLREEGELSVERIDNIQRTENTRMYLNVLENFSFIRIDNGMILPDRKMEAVEIEDPDDIEEYQKQVIGQVIHDAYHVLRDQLNLRMLNHYPKFANSYYYSAIQRQEPNLWLDTEALRANLRQEWDDNVDPLILRDKLRKLEEANVLTRDGDYVSGNTEIYEQVAAEAQAASVAD